MWKASTLNSIMSKELTDKKWFQHTSIDKSCCLQWYSINTGDIIQANRDHSQDRTAIWTTCMISIHIFCCQTEHESWKKLKLVEIHQALNCDPVDIETLRRAAISEGGLLTDEIRRKVWPKLLSVNVYNLPAKPSEWDVYMWGIWMPIIAVGHCPETWL